VDPRLEIVALTGLSAAVFTVGTTVFGPDPDGRAAAMATLGAPVGFVNS
jgi:hypothetical protein